MANDDSIYGFGSTDVQRIGAAVSFVERDPRYTLRKRKYPIGGGGGGAALVPYIITETVEDDMNNVLNVAVYRAFAATVTGQTARLVSGAWETDDGATDEDLDTSVMRGVSFTGQCVLVANVAGEKRIVGGFGGEIFHSASAAEAIDADDVGLINLGYLDAAGDVQYAEVTATNTLDRGFAESDSILLTTFSDASQTFKIIVGGCP